MTTEDVRRLFVEIRKLMSELPPRILIRDEEPASTTTFEPFSQILPRDCTIADSIFGRPGKQKTKELANVSSFLIQWCPYEN